MKLPQYISLAVFFLGILALSLASASFYMQQSPCRFAYVNSDFGCGGVSVIIRKTGYISLENNLTGFIQQQKDSGSITEASVYFRDLRAGPTFAINDTQHFSPASLLKLPLIITFMSMEEENPGILKTNILFEKEAVSGFDIHSQIETSPVSLIEGKFYSVEELMRNTIVYSDNTSYYLLVVFLNKAV